MDPDQYSDAMGAPEEEDGEVDDSSFVQDMGSAQRHHGHSQPDSSDYAHTDFGRPELTIDPTLNGHSQGDHPAPQSQHHRDDETHQHVESHYGYPSLHTHGEHMSESSPSQFPSTSPAPSVPKLAPTYTPTDRTLPPKDVTEETIDDAYVSFILYCNPSVPLDCDTGELRKAFRQPPKSDGKTFNVLTLFKLIERFEGGDIKTWTKLAIELGVERTPDSSTQKVQQYAVRLKRWMHAMHVDAFFEYLLSKPHNYYQQIPQISQESAGVRDGVPVEEDLALRALHPETRPKRGRRKTDDNDNASEKDIPAAKRQHLDASTPATADGMEHFVYPPQSAVPSTAGADGMERFLEDAVTQDQWTAAAHSVLGGTPNSASTPTNGQQFRWRPYHKADSVPTPQSAHPTPNLLTPHDNSSSHEELATPTTATTPTSAKRRRRHGPAVSSAWPSSSNPLTGKLRGRPPTNRSVRDGPFSTFPANPLGKGTPAVEISPSSIGATPSATPVIQRPTQTFPNLRPQNLHLTVPQNPGGNRPIPMASPSSALEPHTNGFPPHVDWPQSPFKQSNGIPPSYKGPSCTELEQRAVVALVRTEPGISREEAKLIAAKLFVELKRFYSEGSRADPAEKLVTLIGASNEERGFKGLKLRRLQTELEELGIHEPEEDDNDPRNGQRERRYLIRWETLFGQLKGEFTQTVVLPAEPSLQGLSEELGDGLAGFGTGSESHGPVTESEKQLAEVKKQLKLRDRQIDQVIQALAFPPES